MAVMAAPGSPAVPIAQYTALQRQAQTVVAQWRSYYASLQSQLQQAQAALTAEQASHHADITSGQTAIAQLQAQIHAAAAAPAILAPVLPAVASPPSGGGPVNAPDNGVWAGGDGYYYIHQASGTWLKALPQQVTAAVAATAVPP